MKSSHLRIAATLASLAVVGTSVSPLLSAPATAVSSKLPYTCQVPTLGTKAFAATIDTTIADTVALNDSKAVTATLDLVIPGEVTKAWYDAGYLALSGNAKLAATQGTAAVASTMTLAQVNLPQVGIMPTVPATSTAKPTATPTLTVKPTPTATATTTPSQSPSASPSQSTTAATDLAVKLTGPVTGLKLDAAGEQIIKAGNVVLGLTMKKADGSAVVLPDFTCTTTAADTTIDKFAVTTQSTLALKARPQIEYGQTAQIEALVGAPGAPVAGNVKFTFAGATTTVPVAGGKAILAIPKPLAVGAYPIAAEFTSTDPRVSASKSTSNLRVVKDRTDTFVRIRGKKSKSPRVHISVDSLHDEVVTGNVEVRVKRRGKFIVQRTVQLHGGDAVVRLPRLQAGRYRIKARFTSNESMRASGKRFGFKVNRRW